MNAMHECHCLWLGGAQTALPPPGGAGLSQGAHGAIALWSAVQAELFQCGSAGAVALQYEAELH